MTLFRSLVTFIASRRSRLGRVVPDEHVSGREQKSSTVFYGEVHPASRALLLLQGGDRETLQKSCHFFEVAAVQISGLVTPVLCRQTGFLQRTNYFVQVNRRSN